MQGKKKLLSLLLALTLMTPGCIGNFALSHEVWSRNMKVDSHFGREALFLGLIIVPVYPIALIADLLIFNTVELFTDENLWSTSQPPESSTDVEP
jgi:hypothetical protein